MRYTIMVVEDDPDIGQLLSLHLQKFGFSLYLCRDFSHVLEEFEKASPHLVLLDINLPMYHLSAQEDSWCHRQPQYQGIGRKAVCEKQGGKVIWQMYWRFGI